MRQLTGGGAVTATGVSRGEGWYDSQTGQLLRADAPQMQPSPAAVYIYDRHYYAAIGSDQDSEGHLTVHMDNPWNQGPGSNGTFDLTEQAFASIFWGYGVSVGKI